MQHLRHTEQLRSWQSIDQSLLLPHLAVEVRSAARLNGPMRDGINDGNPAIWDGRYADNGSGWSRRSEASFELCIRMGTQSHVIDEVGNLRHGGEVETDALMTAIDNEITRQEAFDAGCVAYLKKPFLSKLL